MYRKKRTYRPKKKVDKKQNRAIAKLKRDSYEKVSTVVIPEGQVELKTNAYIDGKSWGQPKCYIQPLSIALRSTAQDRPWGEPETLGGLAKQNARDNHGNILRHRPIFNWGAGGVGQGQITNTTLTTTAGVATGLEQRITGNYRLWAKQRTVSATVNYKITAPRTSFEVSATESGPVFTYVVALIKPVHKQADFITTNNKLKEVYFPSAGAAGSYSLVSPGSKAQLYEGLDYMVNGGSQPYNPGDPADPAVRVFPDTSLTNVIFNPKRWKVLYKKYHNLRDATIHQDVKLVNPDKNFKDQYGKIRVKMNDIMTARMFGEVGLASSATGESGENNDVVGLGGSVTQSIGAASEGAFQHTKNENTCYLVAITNTAPSSSTALGQGAILETRTIFNHRMYNTNNTSN